MSQQPNNNDYLHPIPKSDADSVSKMYKGWTYFVEAPEGPMEIVIFEEKGRAVGLLGHCGKSGTVIMAWLDAFCRIMTKQLERGLITLTEIQEELSGTTSSDIKVNNVTGVTVSSGPEAIFIAITRYQNDKYAELIERLGIEKEMSRQASTRRVD